MAKQTALELKRGEAREEILAMKETILTARVFDRLGRAFKPKSWGYWLSGITLLNLILVTPSIVVAFELLDKGVFVLVFAYGVVATEMVILGIIVAHFTILRTFDDLADKIAAKINRIDDLSQFLFWLKVTWSTRNMSVFVIPFCLVWVILGVGALSVVIHQFVGFGFLLWCVFDGLLAGVLIYILLWACMLVFNLRKYQYEMNFFLPADSEIINEISDMQTKSIYALAVTTAVITLIITSNLIEQEIRIAFSIPFLAIGWTMIASQFFLTRSTLTAITDRARWTTLNQIRIKINSLESAEDLSDKDTAERLFRLIEIHKHIMTSKTNTFDIKSLSTLFSQLMLPLLGLLLGNLDNILDLLQK